MPFDSGWEDVQSVWISGQLRKAMNPLIDTTKPYGTIRFIHFRDGTEHTFTSGINKLTGSRLSGFDSGAPSIDDSVTWVRGTFQDIHRKALRVLEFTGPLAQPK